MIRNVVEVQRDATFDAIGRLERVAWVNERGLIQRASPGRAANQPPFGRRSSEHWMIGTLLGVTARREASPLAMLAQGLAPVMPDIVRAVMGGPPLEPTPAAAPAPPEPPGDERSWSRWSSVATSQERVREAVQRAVAFIPIEAADEMADTSSEDPMDAINVMIGHVRDGAGTSQSIMAFQPFEVAGAGGDDDTVVTATSRVPFRPHRLVVHSSAPPDIEVQLQVGITICVDWTPVGMFSELAIGMGLEMPTVGQGEQVKLVARNRSSPDGAVMLAALTGVSEHARHAELAE